MVHYSLWCSDYQQKIDSCTTNLACQNSLSYSGYKTYYFKLPQYKYSMPVTNSWEECCHWKNPRYISGKNCNFTWVMSGFAPNVLDCGTMHMVNTTSEQHTAAMTSQCFKWAQRDWMWITENIQNLFCSTFFFFFFKWAFNEGELKTE